MRLQIGDILLTAGVGGANSNWRDRMITRAIISHQKIQMRGFDPTRSHAEWITGSSGQTYAARWRTRPRDNGLADYIGGPITIGRAPAMTMDLFMMAWVNAGMNNSDGDMYPLHRLLLQGVGTWVFPWITRIGTGNYMICSEVISKVLHHAHFLTGGDSFGSFKLSWKGNTPAHLEREVRYGDDWEVVFDGVLTPTLYAEMVGG